VAKQMICNMEVLRLIYKTFQQWNITFRTTWFGGRGRGEYSCYSMLSFPWI